MILEVLADLCGRRAFKNSSRLIPQLCIDMSARSGQVIEKAGDRVLAFAGREQAAGAQHAVQSTEPCAEAIMNLVRFVRREMPSIRFILFRGASMRRIRYCVAMSLDGYIAGPHGEADWITKDPDIDFAALFQQFDSLLMGRGTFEWMVKAGHSSMPGMHVVVFSTTITQEDFPNVTILPQVETDTIKAWKASPGKDMWLFGGGLLFRSFVELGLVDTVEVSIIPGLLGGGIQLRPDPASQIRLSLTGHRVYKTGIVSLTYDVLPAPV